MKILVVGLGSIGTRHLNNLLACGVSDVVICRERNLKTSGKLAINGLPIVHDYDNALSFGMDAVVIANPTSLHMTYAKKAIEAGCHVYLEKPVSNSLDGMDEILLLSQKQKRTVMVGCQMRFHPNLEDIRNWVQEGILGKVFSVNVDFGELLPLWHPYEDYQQSYAARKDLGGGVVLTQIHDLDYLFWIFGPIIQVYAVGGHLTPLKIDVEDTALISLLTKEGVPIQIRMDYWRNPPVRKMSVVSEKGEIVWEYSKGEALLYQDGKIIQCSSVPDNWERNDMFLAAMKDFLHSIHNGKTLRCPLKDGIDVLKIAMDVKKSLESGEVIRR